MKIQVRHEILGSDPVGTGLRIAHLSDLHLWFGQRKLSKIDAILEAWRPQVIALTGDYADTRWGRQNFCEWASVLAQMYPVFWITGNHDRWLGGRIARDLAVIPGAHPVDCCDGNYLGPRGRKYRFTTWERHTQQRAGTDVMREKRIVLVHNPAVIEKTMAQGADLILAGHLHGGQLVFARDKNGRALPPGWFYNWCGDRWDLGNVPLIVSRGLGDTLPVRFRCGHEIVMIDL